MAQKIVNIDGIGPVTLIKRARARSIRLAIHPDGRVTVSLPTWTPYMAAEQFVLAKRTWILSQRKPTSFLQAKQRVGKAHHFSIVRTDAAKPTARVVGNEIRVSVPLGMSTEDQVVQDTMKRSAIRVLKKEAAALLPHRLRGLADQHNFEYRSVAIKRLSSRWGSCTSQKDIVLNCYLMNLPWELIDYVLIHELVHTRIMAHGAPFWDEVAQYVPNLSLVRKQMKQYVPTL